MAETEIEHIKPVLAQPDNLDPSHVLFSYDRVSDTLMVKLYGRGRGAYSDPIGDDLSLRIDPNTKEVVGFQIEHFLVCVVREHPALLEVADRRHLRGRNAREVRDSIAGEARQRAALDTIFSHIGKLSYPPDEAEPVQR